jgi:hypothetical protein
VDGPIGYAVSVIVVPALVAVAAAAPVLVGPLRRRAAAVECAVAFALALAFLLSFVRELDENAVVRQFVAIEGDRFPIERWHRLALAAIVLALAGPALAVVRAFDGRNAARYYTAGAVTVAAFLAGLLIEFPRATTAGQILQGATCALATLGFARFSRTGALWNAWVVFGALAALLLLGGFARLMVMSAALSAASFGIAVAAFVGARRTREPVAVEGGGGVGLVLGVLAGLLASAGRGYDQGDLPVWCWTAAALLPFGAFIFGRQSDRAPSREASTFWRVLGAAILAAILLGAVAASQFAGGAAEPEDAGDPMDGIYG